MDACCEDARCSCPVDREVALAGSSWSLWPDAAVRGAGFSWEALAPFVDPHLGAAADRALAAGEPVEFRAAFEAATTRLSDGVREVARDRRFREAVAWQNPTLLATCVDKAAAGEPRNVRGRNHEAAVVSYLQRYAAKNDSIGDFGPVGWAALCGAPGGLEARPGAQLSSRRTVYVECWAVDELADAVSALPGVADWARPRVAASLAVTGSTVRRPRQDAVDLGAGTPLAAVMTECDGERTRTQVVAAVVARTGVSVGDAEAALAEAVRRGWVRDRYEVPVQARAEDDLLAAVGTIGDPEVRARAEAPIRLLIAARDRLQEAVDAGADAAAGAVERGLAEFAAVFERVTGTSAHRRAGQTYAGRTTVYLDAVRAGDVRIGRDLLDRVAEPLALVLDSARWLVQRAAENFTQVFERAWTEAARDLRTDRVPVAVLIGDAVRELSVIGGVLPAPVASAVEEFRLRWAKVLASADGSDRRRGLTVDAARAAVRELFPAGPAPWSGARVHAPDLMFATDATGGDPAAVLAVLGEIHLAGNTLESRLFVEQHDDPARLRDRAAALHGSRRWVPVLPKSSPFVTSRVAPPSALVDDRSRFWSWVVGADSLTPSHVTPAADLLVRRDDSALVVDTPEGEVVPLLELLGELLSPTVLNAFTPVPVTDHRPRVTLGPLVVAREAWRCTAGSARGWAGVADEADRYLAARRWWRDNRLPSQAFVVSPRARKPFLVVLDSLPMVNQLGKIVRAMADDETFVVSEMLPGPDDLWLTDAAGRRHTSEVRLVAVDHAG